MKQRKHFLSSLIISNTNLILIRSLSQLSMMMGDLLKYQLGQELENNSIQDLLCFFAYSNPRIDCIYRRAMLTQANREVVAESVNRMIMGLINRGFDHFNNLIPKTPKKSDFIPTIRKRDTKLERLIKQGIMVVESMQDEGRYQKLNSKIQFPGQKATQDITFSVNPSRTIPSTLVDGLGRNTKSVVKQQLVKYNGFTSMERNMGVRIPHIDLADYSDEE
ncbi:hypothetical protein FGO68_gene8340 [Halteria grandinella]|uniref:Uncharacterized protein n=1 Tax=Halteria grandinella TaxID=5974 RepID=A0A8J8NUS3_HALGN|nr:hypothetical protein FGO68_gene8340 [Halteria grandinella]